MDLEQRRALLAAIGAAGLGGLSRTAQGLQRASPHEPPGISSGRVLRAVPGESRLSLAALCRMARDGDVIELEPGDYVGDVSVWRQSDLTIRGIGPRPRILAAGQNAEGKGIMVLKGKRIRVENLEFMGARVRDQNGAGIRIEDGPVSISKCRFVDNENGVLVSNRSSIEIAIDSSSFERNGNAKGSAHNLYVGRIAKLTVDSCLFARSNVGHLLKSRAAETTVRYSRLTCEDGTSSYELEFPNGGRNLVLGNLIQQGPRSENSVIISSGAEGYGEGTSSLLIAFNTIVNERQGKAIFVRGVKGEQGGAIVHNLLVGPGSLALAAPFRNFGNFEAERREFSNPDGFDYRLRTKSKFVGRAGLRAALPADVPAPAREYVHQATSRPLEGITALTPLSPGAFQILAT